MLRNLISYGTRNTVLDVFSSWNQLAWTPCIMPQETRLDKVIGEGNRLMYNFGGRSELKKIVNCEL